MIILDGPYGVGKTTVAQLICELPTEKYICIDPDKSFNSDPKRYLLLGWPPANNSAIQEETKNAVNEKIKESNIVIPLTLNSLNYKPFWIDSFQKVAKLYHVILIAEKEKILTRINNGVQRDKSFAIESLDGNLLYYQKDLEGTIKIDTSNLSPQMVANMVLDMVR